ncbi:MAG: hypothetical protein ACNA8H_00060 [Anaerolineales bacterium]
MKGKRVLTRKRQRKDQGCIPALVDEDEGSSLRSEANRDLQQVAILLAGKIENGVLTNDQRKPSGSATTHSLFPPQTNST